MIPKREYAVSDGEIVVNGRAAPITTLSLGSERTAKHGGEIALTVNGADGSVVRMSFTRSTIRWMIETLTE